MDLWGAIAYCVKMQGAFGDGSSQCRTVHAPTNAFENQ